MQWNFNFFDQWDKFLLMCDIYPGEFKVACCCYLTRALGPELVFKLKLLFIAYNDNIDA